MSALAESAATRAINAVLAALEDAGIVATRDAGAFYPQPTGVLVGLPTLERRTPASRVYSLPVLVVSGDPLNSELAVDRLYLLADDVATALSANSYRPSSWRSGINAEPLPALEVITTLTETEEP